MKLYIFKETLDNNLEQTFLSLSPLIAINRGLLFCSNKMSPWIGPRNPPVLKSPIYMGAPYYDYVFLL